MISLALCPECLFRDVEIHPDEIVEYCNQRCDGFPNRDKCDYYVRDMMDASETAHDRIKRRLKQIEIS